MYNYYYGNSIASFCNQSLEEIVGTISLHNQFDSNQLQNRAWENQIEILQSVLTQFTGHIFIEFSIPRMGKRVDAILLIGNIVFVVEFKVGETQYLQYNTDQVWDYALDLKNFHRPSHNLSIVPILVATEAKQSYLEISTSHHNDNLVFPLKTNKKDLGNAILGSLTFFSDSSTIDHNWFVNGAYYPTPTIIEAAVSLYNNHSVDEITRSDAGAEHLNRTSDAISSLIHYAKENNLPIKCGAF